MTDHSKSDFTLSWLPSATRNKINIRCVQNGQTIHADEVAIQRETDRGRLADRLESLGCDRSSVDLELLSIATEYMELAKKPSSTPSASPTNGEEIELESIHRPERFMVPGISAMSVPIMTRTTSGISGRFVIYCQNGEERIRCPLSAEMRLGDTTLYIDPVPTEAYITDVSGWSKDSRQRWLERRTTVNPARLFKQIIAAFEQYIDFTEDHREGLIATIALWVVLTYHYHAWKSIGYLLINGPLGSGKSTLFQLLRELVFRPISTDNISAAAIFRTLNSYGGTLLYDEAERLRDKKSPDIAEINSMLMAGYQRGRAATRMEKVGDGFKTVNYQVYGPKAIACINGVSPTLQSRCIEIPTQRAAKNSAKPKLSMEMTNWQAMRDDLHVMSLDHGDDWLHAASRRDVGKEINGRDYELWQPLLSTAAWLESKGVDGLVDLVERFAVESIESALTQRIPEADQILIRMLSMMLERRPTATEILSAAVESNRTVLGAWSADGVGRKLALYGLKTTRTGARREYRQSIDDVRAVCELYSIDLT